MPVLATLALGIYGSLDTASPLPADVKFPSVYGYANASGVAVAPKAILTAKHVGVAPVTVGSRKLQPVRSVEYPDADLRIVFFDEELPFVAKRGVKTKVGDVGTIVGFGDSGVWSPDAGHHVTTVRDRRDVRRAGTVEITEKGVAPGAGPLLVGMVTRAGIASVGTGDSGGGWFVDGKLVGIITIAINTARKADGSPRLPYRGTPKLNDGKPYAGTGAVDITDPAIAAWIRKTLAG